MSLLKEIETLPNTVRNELHSIAAKAGGVITEAEGFVVSPWAYIKANWQPLICAMAIGVCLAAVGGIWL